MVPSGDMNLDTVSTLSHTVSASVGPETGATSSQQVSAEAGPETLSLSLAAEASSTPAVSRSPPCRRFISPPMPQSIDRYQRERWAPDGIVGWDVTMLESNQYVAELVGRELNQHQLGYYQERYAQWSHPLSQFEVDFAHAVGGIIHQIFLVTSMTVFTEIQRRDVADWTMSAIQSITPDLGDPTTGGGPTTETTNFTHRTVDESTPDQLRDEPLQSPRLITQWISRFLAAFSVYIRDLSDVERIRSDLERAYDARTVETMAAVGFGFLPHRPLPPKRRFQHHQRREHLITIQCAYERGIRSFDPHLPDDTDMSVEGRSRRHQVHQLRQGPFLFLPVIVEFISSRRPNFRGETLEGGLDVRVEVIRMSSPTSRSRRKLQLEVTCGTCGAMATSPVQVGWRMGSTVEFPRAHTVHWSAITTHERESRGEIDRLQGDGQVRPTGSEAIELVRLTGETMELRGANGDMPRVPLIMARGAFGLSTSPRELWERVEQSVQNSYVKAQTSRRPLIVRYPSGSTAAGGVSAGITAGHSVPAIVMTGGASLWFMAWVMTDLNETPGPIREYLLDLMRAAWEQEENEQCRR